MDPSIQYQNSTSQPYLHDQQQQQQQQQQAYYAYQNPYAQPQQQYPYYPPPQPNVYHHQSQPEPAPIHPPGVPVSSQEHGYAQTHFQNHPNSYYTQEHHQQQLQQQQLVYTDLGVQGQQWQGNSGELGLLNLYRQTGQTQYSGAGRSRGGSVRGGGHTICGRGRGKGRTTNSSISQATPMKPPPHMAWCELCRVDCNTLEILENHKNGKKHKKNLKVQEELHALAEKTRAAAAAAQMANNDPKPEIASSALPKPDNLSTQPANGEIKAENVQTHTLEEQGRGTKRKGKSGRGGKAMKMNEGTKRPVEPTKPKEVVPFICELCNVKCESAPVFDSHLKGKKHLFNLQRFQEQQATLGQAALQALYPALQVLYPALLQALSQHNNPIAAGSSSTVNGGLDQQVLQWLQAFLPQAGPPMLPQDPASAAPPASEMQSQVQKDSAVEVSTSVEIQVEPKSGIGEQTQEEGNQPEPESKTEELDSMTAEQEQAE